MEGSKINSILTIEYMCNICVMKKKINFLIEKMLKKI